MRGPQRAAVAVADAHLPAAETNAGSLVGSPLEEIGQPADSKLVTLDPFHPGEASNLFFTRTNTVSGSSPGLQRVPQHHHLGAHTGLMAIFFQLGQMASQSLSHLHQAQRK